MLRVSGFNEAGARMLRKWGAEIAVVLSPKSSFNEAGARMLRKWPLIQMRPEHGCSGARLSQASMRPEHGCSGNA